MSQPRENRITGQVGDPVLQASQAREAFITAIGRYEEVVREVGIVQAGLLGVKPGFQTGYIWNVLTEDFTPEQMQQDLHFERLNTEAALTIKESRVHMPLRMANVLPSQVQKLKRKYKENGVELTERVIKAPSNPEPIAGNLGEGDILIGGLKPAANQLDLIPQIAHQAIDRLGGDPEKTYRTFNLDVNDIVRDQKAAEMIRDIAIARNASDWKGNEGYWSTWSLLNSPETVISEIVYSVHDGEAVSAITLLDIKDAVESGTLRLNLT